MAEYSYFEEQFTLEDDFVDSANTDVNSSEFNTVAEHGPEKGEMSVPGQGRARNQTDAIGRIYADVVDSSGAGVSGKARIVVLNSQNNVVDIVSQHKLSSIGQGASNPGDRRPYALKGTEIADPYSLALQVKTDSGAVTVDTAASTFEMDGYRAEAVN